MIKPQCEFTGNRCVKDTCDNCGIYAIHCLSCNITEATEKVGNEFVKLAGKITEEVYNKYYDTARNLHWIGTQSEEHKEEKMSDLIKFERYRLVFRHEFVDGEEIHEIEKPIVISYCVDRMYGGSSIIINEMIEKLKDSLLNLEID